MVLSLLMRACTWGPNGTPALKGQEVSGAPDLDLIPIENNHRKLLIVDSIKLEFEGLWPVRIASVLPTIRAASGPSHLSSQCLSDFQELHANKS